MAKILVVDDDLTVQLVLENALQSDGHQVTLAGDGEEGLLLAKQLHPDLIICDWMMPQLDGLAVCQQIKADPELATTFFMLLTARELVDDRIKGLDAGADDFLCKPIDSSELLARVRAGLRSCHLMQQLSQALQELRQTQAQLVQSEKMSSLGALVAGIAHEINNPVTFIYGNLTHVQTYTQDLIDLLRLYQSVSPLPSIELKEKLEAVDIEFVIDDLPNVLSSMETGTERIQQIVSSLQDFSCLDRDGWLLLNLHKSIDNTLLILQHRLQRGAGGSPIEVIKEYGDLPTVECYAGQLSQAFLNILGNAIDALEEWESSQPVNLSTPKISHPVIRIRTEAVDSNRVVVRIANNGPRISEAVKARIFDPFFTTKPVGRGTGLGLSISYQIVVNQHQGVLKCLSEPGQGVEFWIELPVQQNSV